MLDRVEEPLDQIPSSIKIWAKADWIVAIAARRNVGHALSSAANILIEFAL
jgi:hypothetical protein